jgi:hypothetical protein
MLFHNTWEIDENAQQFAGHPVLGPATTLLQRFRDEVNQNSDGWAHWPLPAKAAKSLMELIDQAKRCRRDLLPDSEMPTMKQAKKAATRIKTFCTKHKLQFPLVVIAPQPDSRCCPCG